MSLKKNRSVLIYLTVIVLSLFIIFVAVHRRPRITRHMLMITRCESTPEKFTLQYRMQKPFSVAIDHHHEGRPSSPPVVEQTNGSMMIIGGGLKTLRSEREITFPSKYDFLRNEHYVTVTIYRGDNLTIEGGEESVEVAPWTVESAQSTKWVIGGGFSVNGTPSSIVGTNFADGHSDHVAEINASDSEREILILCAGTDLSFSERRLRPGTPD